MLAQCKFLIGWYTQNLSADWLSEHERSSISPFQSALFMGKKKV